jgi:hypothetical protein
MLHLPSFNPPHKGGGDMYMRPIPNGFRDGAISLNIHCTLYRRATRHVLTQVAKCIDVDGGIFENVL